ncbi:histidine--tRNA ligase [Campylobacter canadensis]|uniref:Histidine--tRNA ligase n=1 Tax=Campylobacter canadensis TaxID=449520 RepID=A0ABS7WRJ7_9BACT|nr:histidine--tRNA ligase [Campylobacter canadensis]MBZ7987006.1 histidine--tRNA ligase [Campylobacter canadensis]MBZ7998042.1 histidine--tRNA ligase [Campylobacter canadensis]
MINAIKGMNDLLDDDARIYELVINTSSKVAKNYGYSYIQIPHLEQSTLFKRSVGESSDIVGKEMYEFNDKSGDSVCLRPEGTAGVVRAFIEKKMDKANSVKRWFYHGSMFRYEKPQRGRYREFHQFGIECFNIASVYEDASVIMILKDIFDELDIKYTLKINSLGTPETLNNYRAKLREFCADLNLCEDCKRRFNTNIIRVLDCKNDSCQNALKNAPNLSEFLDEECKKDFAKLQELLKENNVSFVIDERLVRGLDYYSKSAFEFISDEIGAKAAIAGGGRYDYLVEYLGGAKSYGVGFAMGVERVMDILKSKQNILKKENKIYFCVLDEKYLNYAFKIASMLRKENKNVILNYEAKKMQKHLNNALKQDYNYFLALGEDEMKENKILFKDLAKQEQKIILIDELKELL